MAIGRTKSAPRAGYSISPVQLRSYGDGNAFLPELLAIGRTPSGLLPVCGGSCTSLSAPGLRVTLASTSRWYSRWCVDIPSVVGRGMFLAQNAIREVSWRGQHGWHGYRLDHRIGCVFCRSCFWKPTPYTQRKPPPQDTAKYRVTNWREYDAALVKRRRLCAAESHDRRRACAIRPVQSPRPAGRPWHRCRTTRDAASTRCPARSAGTRPAPAGPDPSACPYDLAAGGRPEAVQPQRLPQLPASQQAPHCRGRHNRMSGRLTRRARRQCSDPRGTAPACVDVPRRRREPRSPCAKPPPARS